MSTAASISTAIDLALSLITQASRISTLVATAQSEQREIKPEEWTAIQQADDDARAGLTAAITKAQSEGR